MGRLRISALTVLALSLATAGMAGAEDTARTQVQTIVTVLPSGNGAASIDQSALQVKADGKEAAITDWVPLRGDRAGLELVVLIDDAARSGLSLQFPTIQKFFRSLPPSTKVGVAYMQNGRAVFTQRPTADREAAAKALRLTQGQPAINGSPYFALQDLVKKWPPSDDRKEVLMISNGINPYYLRDDPNDPYLQSAARDAQRAGVIVHAIYYGDTGRFARSSYGSFSGQNKLGIVTAATGGKAFFQGLSSPVNMEPFLDDLRVILNNQYELGFAAPVKSKPQLAQLKIRGKESHLKISAPEMVSVPAAETSER